MFLIEKYKIYKNRKAFQKNAVLGENIKFNSTCKCVNNSGDPKNITIGKNSFVMGTLYITKNGRINIGDNFYLGQNSMIGSEKNVTIGNCVIISNDVRIYDNNNHPISPKARENMSLNGFSNDNWAWHHSSIAPVVIEDNVWIGQFSSILKGVTIGKGSIVATRAVVTKDVPPYSIVAGNPAKVVKQIDCE